MNDLFLPPPEREPSSTWLRTREAAIMEGIRKSDLRRTSRWSLSALVAGSAAVAVSLGGVATAYMTGKPATTRDYIRCYTEARVDGGDHFSGTTVAQASDSGTSTFDVASDALTRCAALWRQGFLVEGTPSVVPLEDGEEMIDHPVPALTACTLRNGAAAVLPGDDKTCQKLGLPQLTPAAAIKESSHSSARG